MTARPASGDEPRIDDPAEILRVLPGRYHSQFRSEYVSAVEQARDPEGFHGLAELLKLWRLRAAAYSEPGYAERMAQAKAGDTSDDVVTAQLMPGCRI